MQALLIERYYAHRRAEIATEMALARKAGSQSGLDAVRVTSALHQANMAQCEKILFASSALEMLQFYLLHLEKVWDQMFSLSQPTHSHWIEFDKPIKTGPLLVSACFFCRLSDPDVLIEARHILPSRTHASLLRIKAEYPTLWTLDLIDERGDPLFFLGFDPAHDGWTFPEWHECPSGTCERKGKDETGTPLMQVCEDCQQLQMLWGSILSLSLLIASRHFAKEVQKEYRAVRKVPRMDKPHKLKTVDVSHVFRLIDASVKEIAEVHEVLSHRGSWVAARMAEDPESVQYVDRRVQRTYRHPRYVNVQGQTVEVEVTRPVLVENEVRRVTKVIASDYERNKV